MSSLLYGRWKQYFQIPIAESVERLGLSSYRYYGFLCREMNVHSAAELRYSNAEIARATGIKDHKTISRARKELQTARLIECRKVPPGLYAHIMLDQSGNPIPAPKDRKGIRHYENDKAAARKNGREQLSELTTIKLADTTLTAITFEDKMRECRAHGLELHWQRGEDWLCESCHPNPHSPKRSRPPTAGEIGFK
jgi:hypothetical protein